VRVPILSPNAENRGFKDTMSYPYQPGSHHPLYAELRRRDEEPEERNRCGLCGRPAIGLCRACEDRLSAEADYWDEEGRRQ
jgi:hypothetical protein